MKSQSTDIDLRLLPLGATPKNGGCYFAVWAPNASSIIVPQILQYPSSVHVAPTICSC